MNWKENWPYYRKRILIFLNILVIVFGLIGTYEHYRPIFSETWRLIAAMVYGTVKLYFLSPTISMEAQVTPLYEFAKLLAPMLTGTAILTVLNNAFLHTKNFFVYRFRPKSVVIGETADSSVFAHNLAKERTTRVLLYNDAPLAPQVAKEYEKKGIAVFTHDFRNAPDREARAQVKATRMSDAQNLVLFYDNDLDNYAAFATLLQLLHPHAPMKVRIKCGSKELRQLMQSLFDQSATEDSALAYLDIRFFEPVELIAESLLQETDYPLTTVPVERLAGHTPTSAHDISRALGTSHILAFGFNAITSYLLEKVASTATTSLTEPIYFTIVDVKAEAKTDAFLATHPEIENAVKILPINNDIHSRALAQSLKDLRTDYPPVTYIVLNFRDALQNLAVLPRLATWEGVPMAIRNTSGREIRPLLSATPVTRRAFSYGKLTEVLTPAIILNLALDQKAIRHNSDYNETSERFGNGPGSSWENLSAVKRESSRAAALHAPFKEAVYQALLPAENARETLDAHRDYLAGIFTSGTDHYSANQALLELLDEHPVLDYLTQIEHIRWCHFYYMLDFRHSEVKDEQKKTHPCLIEDWSEISGPLYNMCYPIFDAIAVLSLFGDQSHN